MEARFVALMPSLLPPFFLTTQTPSSAHLKPSFFSKPYSQSTSSRNISLKMSSQTVEHLVLFKVKNDTDPSKINTMVNGLNGLSSIDEVLHLTVGPIHSNHSTSLTFTHMLHSRYDSKEDLKQYAAHPNHLGVVKELVFPICDDLLAFDWINSDLNGPLAPKPGSAMRVTLLKLKEGLCDSDKYEVLRISKGLKGYFSSTIEQSSVGENFSPERAKGFSIAAVSFCPSLSELETADSKMPEFLASQKVNVMKFIESDIGVYYVIPTPESHISSIC